MANSKGNAYPIWIISNNYQVQSVDTQQQVSNQSKENFAMEIAISEDGTVWVLSTEPDPDGGGAKVYWSNGDNQWNEINTSDPGGFQISGYTGSSCIILTGYGKLMSIDTDGSSSVLYDSGHISEFSYGGGNIWAIIAQKPGDIPSLHYAIAGSSLTWQAVGDKVYNIYSLSTDSTGRCFGTQDYLPVFWDTDGNNGSAGALGSHYALSISVKSGNFVLTNEGNADGNLVYEWVIENEGSYSAMNIHAMKLCATYYAS